MGEPEESQREQIAQSARNTLSALRGVNLAEALGEASRKAKRILWSFIVVAIVLSAYPVAQPAWLPITIPKDAGDLVPTLVFVGLVYHWIAFLLYGFNDVLKWTVSIDDAVFRGRWNLVHRLTENLHVLRQTVQEREMLDRGASVERVREIEGVAQRVAEEVTTTYKALSRRAVVLTVWQRLIAWGWELTFPLFAGVWAAALLLSELLE